MEFIKEYAAGTDFPAELSFSCFFWTENELYGIAAKRKQLYRCKNENTTTVNLLREYIKIVSNPKEKDFFSYTQFSNRNEITIYHLDSCFKELDCLKLRKLGGNSWMVDLWFDEKQDFLFLVYPKTILKYNCNGDYLGVLMSAPVGSIYCSICTFENLLFLAYKRNNCPYVGLYRSDGSFKEQLILGIDYQILGMQVITDKRGSLLRLHVLKKGEIPLFCELNFQSGNRPKEEPYIICPANTEEIADEEEIEVEVVIGDNIGEATCHLKPHCQTSWLIT